MDRKYLTGKQLALFSGVALILSLLIHLLAVLQIYQASAGVIFLLSLGILFTWLQASAQIKIFKLRDEQKNPWKEAWKLCPGWMKYLLYFMILYALFNFALSVQPDHTPGYINTSVSPAKLRGISGFWLVFYMFGLNIGYAALLRDQ